MTDSPAPDSLRRYADLVSSPGAFFSCSLAPLPVTGWYHPGKPVLIRSWMAEKASGMSWTPDGFRIEDTLSSAFITGFLTGSLLIQEESAMTSVPLLDVRKGQRILDLCAAPGNKTAQISTLLGESGTVVANDISRARMGVVQGTIDRLGLANVVTTVCDARHFPVPERLFDSVLADVPCSCEGTSRKHPEILTKNNESERNRLVRIQKDILQRAIACVRPGGRVVYSTCTYAPEENEHVINHILKSAGPEFEVELEPVSLPGLTMSAGLESWNGERFDSSITRCARIWPHENNTGGFFLAVLRRKGGAGADASAEAGSNERGPRSAGAAGVAGLSKTENARFEPLWAHSEPILAQEWPWVAHDFNETDLIPWRRIPFSNKYDRLVGADCIPPAGIEVHTIGMTGLNLKSDYPKFSTALALKLGHLARAGTAHIDRDSLLPFFARNAVNPGHLSDPAVDSKTILVQCEGLSLGLASLETGGHLMSRFPKVWGGLEVLDRIEQVRKAERSL